MSWHFGMISCFVGGFKVSRTWTAPSNCVRRLSWMVLEKILIHPPLPMGELTVLGFLARTKLDIKWRILVETAAYNILTTGYASKLKVTVHILTAVKMALVKSQPWVSRLSGPEPIAWFLRRLVNIDNRYYWTLQLLVVIKNASQILLVSGFKSTTPLKCLKNIFPYCHVIT